MRSLRAAILDSFPRLLECRPLLGSDLDLCIEDFSTPPIHYLCEVILKKMCFIRCFSIHLVNSLALELRSSFSQAPTLI